MDDAFEDAVQEFGLDDEFVQPSHQETFRWSNPAPPPPQAPQQAQYDYDRNNQYQWYNPAGGEDRGGGGDELVEGLLQEVNDLDRDDSGYGGGHRQSFQRLPPFSDDSHSLSSPSPSTYRQPSSADRFVGSSDVRLNVFAPPSRFVPSIASARSTPSTSFVPLRPVQSLPQRQKPVIRPVDQPRSLVRSNQVQAQGRKVPNYGFKPTGRQVVEQLEEEADYFGADDADFEMALGSLAETTSRTDSQVTRVPVQSKPVTQRSNQQIQSSHRNAPSGIRLRSVAELPDSQRSIFKFGVFNAVQSTCFDTIYKSDRNAVISAPTGAGKTVLFELAILRLFSTSASDVKVVYIAPTKSLCTERANDWKTKFSKSCLGWNVVELTGDSTYDSLRTVGDARIIVTTPEKWDAMTRQWHKYSRLLASIRLFCIDEVHYVGADVRGAVLEVLVSRVKTLGNATRFVALSATIPNVEDVAEWLGTASDPSGETAAKVFNFGEEYRPCKLSKIVIGYPSGSNEWGFQTQLRFQVMDLIKQYSSGKPVVIFCNTRKECVGTAEALAKAYRQLLSQQRSSALLPWPRPGRCNFNPTDKKLIDLLETGIAYHHAGVDGNDRKLIETSFVNGSISIVCATSTLAVGVNLPARMVIIKGTQQYANSAFKEYSELDIQQMMGRAGRPQFDTLGIACIMTQQSNKLLYDQLSDGRVLESGLHNNLIEHLNSEITLKTITSTTTALHWLRSTFLFVRINKNPKFYALVDAEDSDASPASRLEDICVKTIKGLVDDDLAEEQAGTDLINPTQFGDMMAKYYLQYSTFLNLKKMPKKGTMRTLLATLSSASEFSSFNFRGGEKGSFGKINKSLRYSLAKVSTTADKINMLIQLVLQGTPLADLKSESGNLNVEVYAIWPQVVRIAKCMTDLALEDRDGVTAKVALELLRSINCKAWDDSPAVLRQLEGIGEKGVKMLADKGIMSLDDVKRCEPSRLEVILNRNPPAGRKLVLQAQSYPEFTLDLAITSEFFTEGAVRAEVSGEVGLVTTKPPPILKKGNVHYSVSILIITNDGEFVMFRRIKADKLLKGSHSFTTSVDLIKPSQRIVGMLTCEEIAGNIVRSVVKPTTDATLYPVPIVGQPALPSSDGEAVAEVDLGFDVEAEAERPAKKKKVIEIADDAEGIIEDDEAVEPVRLPSGKYACNHACGDKTKCRHLCCREGTDKPPKRKKSKATPATTTTKAKAKVAAKPTAKDKLFDSFERLEGPGKAARPVVKAQRLINFPSTTNDRLSVVRAGPNGKYKANPRLFALDSDDEDDADSPSLQQLFAATGTRRIGSSSSVQKDQPKPSTKKRIGFEKYILDEATEEGGEVGGYEEEEELNEYDLDDDEVEEEEEVDQLASPTPSPPQLKKRSNSNHEMSKKKQKRSALVVLSETDDDDDLAVPTITLDDLVEQAKEERAAALPFSPLSSSKESAAVLHQIMPSSPGPEFVDPVFGVEKEEVFGSQEDDAETMEQYKMEFDLVDDEPEPEAEEAIAEKVTITNEDKNMDDNDDDLDDWLDQNVVIVD